jgi:hypothetical protein
VEGRTLVEMIKEDLVAERVALESYGEIIRYLGNDDPTSRRLMEEILAKEEEHAENLTLRRRKHTELSPRLRRDRSYSPSNFPDWILRWRYWWWRSGSEMSQSEPNSKTCSPRHCVDM